jgi:PucR C-terminal helix-turn-helix domain/GGDEF-like domain
MIDAVHPNRAMLQTLERLLELGVIPDVAPALRRSADYVEGALREAVLGEVAAFSDSRNPQIIPDLKNHSKSHVVEIARLFEGGEPGDLAFVRAHARRRAEQRFPLEATLHAYRCGHRVLSRWLRDAATNERLQGAHAAIDAIADFAIEYTNVISAAMTSEYVAHTRLIEAAEGDRRTELLNIMLSGYDESDGRIARLLELAGYLDQRRSYCVVGVRTPIASELENPERTQRIVAALAELFAPTNIRVLAGPRNSQVIAVLSSLRRQSGWTAPQTNLAERSTSLLLQLGPSVLVGVSADRPSTASIPKALREAMAALDFAGVDRRVVLFSELPVRSLLIHAGGEYVRSATPAWAAGLLTADAKAGGTLVRTLSALADADLNVQKAGRRLEVHPNTVYARLHRIRNVTGLNGQRHHDLVELLLAAECARI